MRSAVISTSSTKHPDSRDAQTAAKSKHFQNRFTLNASLIRNPPRRFRRRYG